MGVAWYDTGFLDFFFFFFLKQKFLLYDRCVTNNVLKIKNNISFPFFFGKSVSYQKKGGRGHKRLSFFWNDNSSGHWGPFCMIWPTCACYVSLPVNFLLIKSVHTGAIAGKTCMRVLIIRGKSIMLTAIT